MSEFKKGDAVSYRTKDQFGYQWINALVQNVSSNGNVGLLTQPGKVSILVPAECLTKIKTVWMDTHKPVKGEN